MIDVDREPTDEELKVFIAEIRRELVAGTANKIDHGLHLPEATQSDEETLRVLDLAEQFIAGDRGGDAMSPDSLVGQPRSVELPEEFKYPGYDPDEIPITPRTHKFETVFDAVAWAYTATKAAWWRIRFRKPEFIRHSASDEFVYPLELGTGGSVALLSDFANGYYHARYIVKHIEELQPTAVVHLGDVYYTGRRWEVEEYLELPLSNLVRDTQVFVMNANHEMNSHGVPYYAYLTRKRDRGGWGGRVAQPQKGSYFCLRGEEVQMIGIDTAFFGDGRFKDRASFEWLARQLTAGRDDGLVNILMSQSEPFNRGKKRAKALLRKDLAGLVDQVDLWFWGDEHYCALYGPSLEAPFYGSCIGHAGYPYMRLSAGDADTDVAPTIWEETGPRFPSEFGNLRQDVGSNGWCMVSTGAGALTLTYYDWLRRVRRKQVFQMKDGELSL